jgi:hypothetical protein
MIALIGTEAAYLRGARCETGSVRGLRAAALRCAAVWAWAATRGCTIMTTSPLKAFLSLNNFLRYR